MDSKHIFIWPVLISIVGHAALITVSSMVDLRENVKRADIFTVQIAHAQPEPVVKPQKENKATPEKTPKPLPEAKPIPAGEREETVDIGSSDVKYAAYLADVKKKILRVWQYPVGAYENSEEGVVVIKISINADGTLAQTTLTTPSGFPHLDSGTLDVVGAAAPFRPLPPTYDLSRLHIIASFNYRLKD
jgi:TonB family protein